MNVSIYRKAVVRELSDLPPEEKDYMTRELADTAEAMQTTVDLMRALGMETRQYRQQVLTVTGEITTDVLDMDIVAGLFSQWAKTLSLELRIGNDDPHIQAIRCWRCGRRRRGQWQGQPYESGQYDVHDV